MTTFTHGQLVRIPLNRDHVHAYRCAYHEAYLSASTWPEKQAMKTDDHPYMYRAPGDIDWRGGVRRWQIGTFIKVIEQTMLDKAASTQYLEVVFDGESLRVDEDDLIAAEAFKAPSAQDELPVGSLIRLVSDLVTFERDMHTDDDDPDYDLFQITKKMVGLVVGHRMGDDFTIQVLFGEQLVYTDCRLFDLVK